MTACLPGKTSRGDAHGEQIQDFALKLSQPFHEDLIKTLRAAGRFGRAARHSIWRLSWATKVADHHFTAATLGSQCNLVKWV